MAENVDLINLVEYRKSPLRQAYDTVLYIVFCVSLMGIGVFLDSSAMQWMGFVTIILFVLIRDHIRKKTRTPQEAADYLYKQYGVTGR